MAKYRAFPDSWSVNSFVKRFEKGEINFDNPIQRGIVWNKRMSSLYIHSLLYDILIYQKPFLVSKKESGWDVLDGKQRGNTLIHYINGDFALSGLEKEPQLIVNGEPYKLNGKKFKQLNEDLQMKILDFQIGMAVLEEAPVEIEALFFERSNGGKAMAKVDLARSKNRSISTVKEIATHEIFQNMFSIKKRQEFAEDEIVIKTWQALNETDPDYSLKHFQDLMETLKMSDEDKSQIVSIYDKVLEAYKFVLSSNRDKAVIMLKKTHLLAYIAFVGLFKDSRQLADWIMQFYSAIPEQYAEASKSHTAGKSNSAIRAKLVQESIEDFLVKAEQESQVEQLTLQET